MAFKALWTKTPKVRISVAIDAFWTTPGQHLLPVRTVTAFTGQEVVCAFKAESPEIMILHRIDRPVANGMAFLTIGTEFPLVHI